MPDDTYNTKNYEEQGGDVLVIGGALDVRDGKILSNGVQAAAITKPTAGTTVDAESRAAINSVIDALKAVGITL